MQEKKRAAEVAEDTENRGRKRQRRSEETITNIPHESTPSVSIRMDDATMASRQHSMSDPVPQPSKIVIPSKRRNPFGGGGLRKKNKTAEGYVGMRIYAQRRDLVCTHEIQCALMPDGALDLVNLSKKLNLERCEVS